ncbi:type VII secretion-associated serine protease mycosin [Micromonospora sp. NBC_01813]|uniref:type VII secretion-associated serine protease mycosin n=1 Tax=Micromonospora sp. NBC_01813 TaxID=2975988 RepID=UPI002DD9330E|nr:type VII secretion-associated serine protease mycosin [Micromonospora sp. NBC_01813]WSA06272.1 type VII secretion-associated serine protease mycosin [Micromonospora sp. NBC_01813]
MNRTTAAVAVMVIVLAAPLVGGGAASAVPPAGACRDPEPARPTVTDLPWAQQLLDLRGAWRHSTGTGVTVAVIDSGVDGDHPQLTGSLLRGRDFFLAGDLPGGFDCVSHGTAVGSVVAARPVDGVGFHGVAPGAKILPVRITDRQLADSGQPTPIDPAVLARGIRYAADQRATVINLSVSGYGDFPAVRAAVDYARSKDALVVAAVGNREDAAAAYPAGYPGVLGVGAIDAGGARASGSQAGVDIVAPGAAVIAAARVGGHAWWDGTSIAAPFVAGTAALVRSARPDLSADQVARVLLATAAPARGGRDSPDYGAGIVDPYRAVTESQAVRAPGPMPAVAIPPPDPQALHAAAWWQRTGGAATACLGVAATVILLAAVFAWAVPRGRRRRWTPTRAAPPPVALVVDELPEETFLFPAPAIERGDR